MPTKIRGEANLFVRNELNRIGYETLFLVFGTDLEILKQEKECYQEFLLFSKGQNQILTLIIFWGAELNVPTLFSDDYFSLHGFEGPNFLDSS